MNSGIKSKGFCINEDAFTNSRLLCSSGMRLNKKSRPFKSQTQGEPLMTKLKLVYLTSWHDADMKYDFHINLNLINVCCSFMGLTLLPRALKGEGLSLTELSVYILIPCLLKRKKYTLNKSLSKYYQIPAIAYTQFSVEGTATFVH